MTATSPHASTAAGRDPSVPVLTADDVSLQYTTRERMVTATWRVSFKVHKSDRFVLLGPSGCGKSSLLKSVAGFLPPVEGRIRLNGRDIKGPGPDRMMVFQEFDQLLPWKSVFENVAYPMRVNARFPKAEIEQRVHGYLDKIGLTRFANAHPHTLSGGMKQRVAIARAMAMEPEVLLMDEPFAALDALTRRTMQAELLRLWEDTRFTILFVTHSIEEALIIGTRILVLSPHPGQVRAELDASGLGFDSIGTPRFAELQARIEHMLFAGRPGHTEEAHP